MVIDERTAVGDIAARLPEAQAVFEDYGVDYYCQGMLSLDDACAVAGAELDRVQRDLEGVRRKYGRGDWAPLDGSLRQLIAILRDDLHRPIREQLPRLASAARRFAGAGERGGAEFGAMGGQLEQLAPVLIAHLDREDSAVLPFIAAMEDVWASGRAPLAQFAGGLDALLRQPRRDHDAVAECLGRLRRLRQELEATLGLDAERGGFLAAMRAFEALVHRSIHLENHVVFPRAAVLEAELYQPDDQPVR